MAYTENWKNISIHGKDIAPSKNRKSNIKRVIAMLESQLEEDE